MRISTPCDSSFHTRIGGASSLYHTNIDIILCNIMLRRLFIIYRRLFRILWEYFLQSVG